MKYKVYRIDGAAKNRFKIVEEAIKEEGIIYSRVGLIESILDYVNDDEYITFVSYIDRLIEDATSYTNRNNKHIDEHICKTTIVNQLIDDKIIRVEYL